MEKKSEEYCDNPYLDSFGVQRMKEKMIRRYGKQYTEYRERWARAEELNELEFPVNLELDLIDACTLSCPQCLRSSDILPQWKDYLGKGSVLDYTSIVKVLDEGKEYKLPSVNIGGSGECMLHPDFLKICEAIMERDILELRVISNGTRLTREISKGLIDNQVHFLSISIDACSAETYALVRGKKDMYQGVVDNVKEFLKQREEAGSDFPMLRVTFVRQQSNKHEEQQFIEKWSPVADLVDIQTYSDYREQDTFSSDFSCNQPWKRLAIYADGHVVPCCGFPGIKFNLGSIYDMTLKEMWDGGEMDRLRKLLLKKQYPKACLQCMGSLVSF
ncbi:radical SAM/SPASM domain-containing protein [Desulfogranum mediterraneum]|uniref:radical SAM/SPASM domain-containing protein n=1 Tax=Desulfogranum mediterraneum TaxID=160661 RepID=UPI0003F9887D|nr:radical SAM protein [Desulfogranum mediterraneum]